MNKGASKRRSTVGILDPCESDGINATMKGDLVHQEKRELTDDVRVP
jgi:hypothetical protein